MKSDALFFDTSYAVALGSESDQYHDRARSLSHRIKTQRPRLVTTTAVVLEIGDAFARRRLRSLGAGVIQFLESDPSVEVVPLTDELYQAALQLYFARNDKEWGLTDCVSFVVMRERGITDALTADDHFRQAGFRALMQS